MLFKFLSMAMIAAAVSITPAASQSGGSATHTVSKDDLAGLMSARELQRLKDINASLRIMGNAGRQMPEGSPERESQLQAFQRSKKNRDEEFEVFRGLQGQTFTVHGDPPPSKAEILQSIVAQRRSGSGGILHPHWNRGSDGRVTGGTAPPKSTSLAAGKTVGGPIRIRDRPKPAASPRPNSPAGPYGGEFEGCLHFIGPPKSDYRKPFCVCIYGVECSWIEDPGRP